MAIGTRSRPAVLVCDGEPALRMPEHAALAPGGSAIEAACDGARSRARMRSEVRRT